LCSAARVPPTERKEEGKKERKEGRRMRKMCGQYFKSRKVK
jgi:hypothetical protein